MKIQALISFAGPVTMAAGDIREVETAIGNDLIKANYAKKVSLGVKKSVKSDEN